jgi:glyoxylate/hydroxypyruvate reductase A
VREPAVDRRAFPVGIMGLGDIGAKVAQAVAGFDYPTLGWSRTLKSLPGITCYGGKAALDEFLSRVRVLVCVLPLTAETEGILNAATLSKLRSDAYLINVARGRHLVESDLMQMLASGHLAGATLDVCGEEPLPPQHPFWRHPGITITPHISAITLLPESVVQIAEKICALERGESIDGVIETGRGY